jgi:uncharacterized protein
MWTPEMLFTVIVIFALGGVVKGVAGIGLPTVAIALMAIFIGLKEGIALMVVPTIVTNIWQALVGGYLVELLRRLWSLLLAATLGVLLGGSVLVAADATILAMLLGGVLSVYAGVSLVTPQIPAPGKAEKWLSPTVGVASGLIGGMTGTYAVPGVVYMQSLGLSRDKFVQAMGISFLVFTAALGVSLIHHGLMTPAIGALSTIAVIPAMAGMALGQILRRRLSEARFRQVFFLVLLSLGLWIAFRPLLG